MNARYGIVSRTAAFVAVIAAVLMLGVPSFILGGDSAFSAVGSAEAQGIEVDRKFILGVGDLTYDSLNPNTYTMVSEGLMIFYCYSTLLGYDVNTDPIGDLATEWHSSPDGLTWYFKLVENAYFCDPANPTLKNHPVTATDIVYSFWELQNNTQSRLYSYVPGVIEDMWYANPYEVWIQLNQPFAPIMDAFLGVPILPRYYWESESFINFDNLPPIGSGPLYYATVGLPETGSCELRRNPIWFQTENKGWQLHTDAWIIKEELSPDGALINLNNGDLDCMMRVPPALYLNTLPTWPNTVGFSQAAGFVYEYNLNQMTDELRVELGGSFNAGENNQLLLDPVLKRAIAMSYDKQTFVDDILLGLGSVADGLVPPANPGHYTIPDPIVWDPVAAKHLLWDAGWQYDQYGNPADFDTTCPLAKIGGTDVLEFRFYTLDTTTWLNAAVMLRSCAEDIGVKLNLEQHSVSEMNTYWYAADYDMWLWDWDMGVLGDAAGILEVCTTGSIGISADFYWSNETFDALYELALVTIDPVEREEILNTMQQMVYDNMGCQCVAYSNNSYGVSTVTWAPESLGDWNSYYTLLPDIFAQWVSMRMYPKENHAPYFTSYTGSTGTVTAEVGVSKDFLATGLDDDPTTPLVYRWFWGDGARSDWSSSGAASHTYTSDGVYEVWVAVREDGASNGFDDNFTTCAMTMAEVYDMSNLPPTSVSFTYSPLSPDSGTYITFEGSATDPDGDDVYYSWGFGDGHSDEGQSVEYQFGVEGSFTVTLSVTDNRLGYGTRPVTSSQLIYVARNQEPTISVPDFTDIPLKVTRTYTVTASDPDDSLRYTWDWGDDDISVTTTPSTNHQYDSRGTYVLTVYADDLTGLAGHNVSDSGNVYVYNPQSNKAPEVVSFTVDDNTPYTGQTVTFTVVASDADGDALKVTVSDAYGVYCVESFDPTDQEVTLTVDRSYATVKPYTVYAYVFDGVDNTTSSSISVTVTLNFAPVLADLPHVYGSTGASLNFAADVYDLDDDPLTYTWDWGDGGMTVTDVEVASHAYAESGDYVYRVYVDDGCGHNVTKAAGVFVNAIPVIEPLVDVSVTAGETHPFTATVTDADWEDVLTYTWDFGDGSDYAFGESVDHVYASAGTYSYTLWVDDGFVLPSHNVSDSASVQVLLPMSDPPVADAGPDQTESGGVTVQFDGSGSSDDVGVVSYTWTFTYDGGPVTLTGVDPTFVFWVVGVYDVILTVVDGDGQSDTDTVQITIPDIIPEFPMLLLPVAGIVILLVGLARRRKQ